MLFTNEELFQLVKGAIQNTLNLTAFTLAKDRSGYTEGMCEGLRSALESIDVIEHYVAEQKQKEKLR